MSKAQFGAAGQAAAAKAKLLGFMRDRIEVGCPGEFAICKTPDDVVDLLMANRENPAELTDSLRELADLIEARAAHLARPIPMRKHKMSTRDEKLNYINESTSLKIMGARQRHPPPASAVLGNRLPPTPDL
ncbi:hypothetical protein [Bradyrhizobium sp. SZCCHNR1075]|uniref:hypothetical protein n=1 Tax=Bradyrhizobium sp. SZCCHNR1075 TaxID=3057362 RepID=UPI0028F16483|nr:hypothetical protein [Bradyrhizobium sp. SZCCHNR1075]